MVAVRRALGALLAGVVTVAGLSGVSGADPAAAAPKPDPDSAETMLRTDADGPVRIHHRGGVATFVGAPTGTGIDNPAVSRTTGVAAAGRAHLQRYGAAIGADRPGTALVPAAASTSVAGKSVLRYRQEIGGVPVVGGDVVVTLDRDRELASMSGNLSAEGRLPAATVDESSARTIAEAVVARRTRSAAAASSQGRWAWDAAAVGLDGPDAVRGAWRFEVVAGAEVRRLVLVDDQDGAVLLDADMVQSADRVVCDVRDVVQPEPVPCRSGFARTESGAASAVVDVNRAFSLSGVTSTFYAEVAGIDLTDLIGLDIDTTAGVDKRLASSVRVCYRDLPCPYDGAFWNGDGVHYGRGWAGADDVVAHELTHGVIERTSGLLYWDQAGAVNESLADIIGEIVDHRHVTAGESATDWRLGEDSPVGAVRNAATPAAHGQPDRITSPLWELDADYWDRGGVHTNSGVGNKAFHLISQGGSFNGRTVAGIDAGDPTLAKSAALWVQAIQTIGAFTEYDDLALVLEEACSALVGTRGFTAEDCVSVSSAIAATEMRTRPASAPVRDAARSCPAGSTKRVLLDSESVEEPTAAFVAAAGWGRTPDTTVNAEHGVNAYSGDTAWVGTNAPIRANWSLTASAAVDLPQGQGSYLAFRHWHLFEFVGYGESLYFDGGTVEVDDVDDSVGPRDTSALPWTYGPRRVLEAPNAGRRAFAGSSRGWVGSRVELSDLGGKAVKPVFTVRTDENYGEVGWYLDDIELYTCDGAFRNLTRPSVPGTPRVGRALTASPGTWSDDEVVLSYQWRRNGTAISGADRRSYTPGAADRGQRLSVAVTAAKDGYAWTVVGPTSAAVAPGIITPQTPTISGRAKVGQLLSAVRGTWTPGGITFRYRWLRDGRAITGATVSTYRLTRSDARHRIQVRVTGSKAGYTTVSRTSTGTALVVR